MLGQPVLSYMELYASGYRHPVLHVAMPLHGSSHLLGVASAAPRCTNVLFRPALPNPVVCANCMLCIQNYPTAGPSVQTLLFVMSP